MIPLPPSKIHHIWKAVKPFKFDATHGGFTGSDIRGPDLKQRILESMKIQVRSMGHDMHSLLEEPSP